MRVYRPVTALKVKDDIYLIQGEDIYDPEDEHWEFKPGTFVNVELIQLHDGPVMAAVSLAFYTQE